VLKYWKVLAIAGFLFTALAVLVWVFSEQLAGWFIALLNMEAGRRTAIRESLQIVAASVGGVSGVLGAGVAIKTLFKREVPDSQKLLSAYYRALRSSCERIDLSLLKLAERARHLNLHEIYQEVDATPYLSRHAEQRAKEGKDKAQLEVLSTRQVERKPLLNWCTEDDYRKVVILGDAGFGKSMFVETLTWQLANALAGDAKGKDLLPAALLRRPVIRLRLRAVAVRCFRQGVGANFLLEAMQQMVRELVGETDAEATWAVLWPMLQAHGVILLDGLDEVPESEGRRLAVLEAIDKLVRQLGDGDVRLIVSSRPYVFESDHAYWLESFATLQIKSLDDEQMARFITHWYALTATFDHRSEADSQREADSLYREIIGRAYLEEPARSPMILTLLIAQHLSNIKLPESRAKLYEASIELMLDHWTQRARREDGEYPLENFEKQALLCIDGKVRLSALMGLALAAHRKKTLLIAESEILGMFASHLPSDCNPTTLLDFIRYRSGLLKSGEDGCLEFYHRSFQEYLAARAISDLADWQDEIHQLLEQDFNWWQEVYLLLVGSQIHGGSRSTAVQLLERYVPESVQDYEERDGSIWPWVFLAARGVVEQQVALTAYTQGSYPRLRGRLEKHLLHLVQGAYALPIATRAEAGRLLGELGDPRSGVGVKEGWPDFDWVEIPPGTFLMGAPGEAGDASEKPAHSVTFKQSFKISRYPVTNAQFACFVEAGGYGEERYWRTCDAALAWWHGGSADLSLLDDNPRFREHVGQQLADDRNRRQPRFWRDRQWNNPNHPVVGICWYEALAYCAWLNETQYGQGGGRIRLPTEAEWEYAARGPSALVYAWGQEGDSSKGNCRETGLGRTSTVGLFPPGLAFALGDMSGNVWEWTSSQWGKKVGSTDFSYEQWQVKQGDKQAGQQNYLNEQALRIIRGGDWDDVAKRMRCTFRFRFPTDYRTFIIGFRLVLSL